MAPESDPDMVDAASTVEEPLQADIPKTVIRPKIVDVGRRFNMSRAAFMHRKSILRMLQVMGHRLYG